MGRVEEYRYDAGGRMTERVTPGGNRIVYDYNRLNQLAEKTCHNTGELENDRPVRMGYNGLGQRISMEDITGESAYAYDSLGRLKTATNGSGKVVEYVYDEADNLSGILYPDGYSVLYEYDKNDNITKLTDRDGRDTVYEYDPLNRLTKAARPDGSTSTYTYNARNQVLEAKNTCICGELISSYQYTYDDGGLIIKEVAKENLFTSGKDYGHAGGASDKCMHKAGNPWQNQNPEWETTTRIFTYDDNGQMTKCEESRGRFDKATYTYAYDEAGNRTLAKKAKLYSYLESWQNTYVYNDDNQMVEATKREGNLTKKYTFTYDANGNLTRECYRNKAEVTYQYDAENRLVAVYDQQKLLVASTYDGDGNRAFQLNYNPEAECGYGMSVSGEIFMPENSRNEDGSLTAEGQLFSYICSKTGRSYDLTEYVNDTNRQYAETLTAYTVNSGATESYSYAGNRRLSRNNIWDEARGVRCNQTSYYQYDGRGSVTANTWHNGMVTSVYRYDPYGQVELGSTKHTDFYGYNGESYNPNSGLEYLRARHYSASQGRFFQEDTYLGDIADPLTLNRYAYVKNSPMNYVDPSGHDAESEAKFKRGLNVAFGFSDEEGSIIVKLYHGISEKVFRGLGAVHEVVKLLASVVYNDKKWQVVSDFYSPLEVKRAMKRYGIADTDINSIISAIKANYRLTSGDYKEEGDYIQEVERVLEIELCGEELEQYKSYYDRMIEKSDFAHMLASMEAYFNSPDWAVSLITGMTNGIFSKAKNLGYAGDIYGVGSASPSLGPDDYMADLDAVNLAVLSGNSEDIFKIWGDYFSGIEDGTINRASDFATNLGNGDKEKGKELLEKEVNKFVKSKNRTIHIGNKTINIGKKTDTSVAVMFLNNILDENNELVR